MTLVILVYLRLSDNDPQMALKQGSQGGHSSRSRTTSASAAYTTMPAQRSQSVSGIRTRDQFVINNGAPYNPNPSLIPVRH